MADAVKIPVPPAAYWALRTRLLEHQSLTAQAQDAVAKSEAGLKAAVVEAGLPPERSYTLNDTDCSATETEAAGHAS